MNDQHGCPLCTETYAERTDLRVHLEVEHRKSELVIELIELHDTGTDSLLENDSMTTEEERRAPSAD